MNNKNEYELEQREPLVDKCSPDFFKFLFKIDYDALTKRRKVDEFTRMGGQEGILEKLKTNKVTGLNSENSSDFNWRSRVWGMNKKNDIVDRSYFQHTN